MAEQLTELSSREFSQQLAAKVSVPGGGGAAAMVGAYGAALCSMAANFTTGKKKYAQYEGELQKVIEKTKEIREELLALAQKDADNFEPLSKAYAIPKDDPGRAQVLEEATVKALEAPMEMMRSICRSIELLERTLVIGSVMMVSDVGCGAILAKAALESASLNVYINTKTLGNRTLAQSLEEEADSMIAEYGSRAQAVADAVTAKLRNR